MSDGVKTLCFLLVAIGLCVGAFFSAPSIREPEAFRDVGEVFFEKFDNPLSATTLEVVEFDAETAELKPFKVELTDAGWTIPSHHSYPVDAEEQMAKAAGVLIGLKKEDVRSDSVDDHGQFGVLDPTEQKLEAGGSGKLVSFKDSAGNTLASLILGKQLEGGDGMRYVRLPGTKRTYVAKLPAEVSATFSEWIETDLLKAKAWELEKLAWDNYSIDENTRSRVEGERIEAVKVANQWTIVGLKPEEEIDSTAMNEVTSTIGGLKIVGVRPKPQGLSAQLKQEQGISLTQESLISLQFRGFYVSRNGTLHSNEGDLYAMTRQGVVYTLRFGEILFGVGEGVTAGSEREGSAERIQEGDNVAANRFLMVTVDFDESLLRRPTVAAALPEESLEMRAEARTEIEKLVSAVQRFKAKNDSLPQSLADLLGGDEPFLAELPKDPWASDYSYVTDPEGGFRVVSYGEDQAPGGEGAGADIASDAFAAEDQLIANAEEWAKHAEEIEKGRKLANELRARFAPWYYVISDESFRKLRRDRHELTVAKAAEEEGK